MSDISVEQITVGELDTNCYIVWCTNTYEAIIIDPGDAGDSIAERVLELQLQPKAILLTHGHFDHVLGCLAVQTSFDIPIYLHPADNFLIDQAHQSAQYWLKHDADPVPPANEQLKEGQQIYFGDTSVSVVCLPGHTPGSVGLLWNTQNTAADREQFKFSENDILFGGDVIFKHGYGRTDFRYSNKKDFYQSLKKIKELGTVLIKPGHDEEFVEG